MDAIVICELTPVATVKFGENLAYCGLLEKSLQTRANFALTMHAKRTKPNDRYNLLTAASSKLVLGSVIGFGTAIYFLYFLTCPLLIGFNNPDGQPVSRIQYLLGLLVDLNSFEKWFSELRGDGRFPVDLADRIPIVLIAMAALLVAFKLGRPVIRLAFRNTAITIVESISLSTLVGLAFMSTGTLLFGLVGLSSSRIGPVVFCVAAILTDWKLVRGQRVPKPNHFQVDRWLPVEGAYANTFAHLTSRLVVVLVMILAVFYLLSMMMPPYDFDVVEYHLQAPKEFYQIGRIFFCEHNVYNNMPLGLEMHSLAAMSLVGGSDGWWLGGLIGKAIVGLHTLLAAALIGGFVARLSNRWTGWSAAGLWMAVPGNFNNACSGLIDSALGAYIVAGCIVATQLIQSVSSGIGNSPSNELNQSDRRASTWMVFLLFLFAGFAAAAKYTGLIYAVCPATALVAGLAFRWPIVIPRPAWLIAIFCGIAVTCLPWYGKNLAFTGNPFYPLAYSVFGGKGLDEEQAQQWSMAHRVPDAILGETVYGPAALVKSIQRVTLFADAVLPSLIVLGLLGWLFVLRKCVWGNLWLTQLLWMFAVWWFATHRIDRFWLPSIALQAVMAGAGLNWMIHRISLGLGTVIVLVGLVYGIVVSTSSVQCDNRFLVKLDSLRDDGGDDVFVGRINTGLAWCNKNLNRPDVKVLLVGEARVFDFKMPIIYSTCFNRSKAEVWLKGRAADVQLSNLRSAGVTHVFVCWTELSRYRSPGNYGFSDWPVPDDLKAMVDTGVLEPVDWGQNPNSMELFKVR
jgi:hypothetical protein